MSTLGKILLVLLGMAALGSIVTAVTPKKTVSTQTPVEAAATAAEDARKDKVFRHATEGAVSIRSGMKDPTSFELTSAVDRGEGIVCYQFRAKNGFGAQLPDSAVLTSKGQILLHSANGNKFVSYWNKHCTNAGGTDTTGHVDTMLSVMK